MSVLSRKCSRFLKTFSWSQLWNLLHLNCKEIHHKLKDCLKVLSLYFSSSTSFNFGGGEVFKLFKVVFLRSRLLFTLSPLAQSLVLSLLRGAVVEVEAMQKEFWKVLRTTCFLKLDWCLTSVLLFSWCKLFPHLTSEKTLTSARSDRTKKYLDESLL